MLSTMFAQRATAIGGVIWAVAFAWHPILLDPADAAGVAATVARTPNWPWIHLLAALGLAIWSLGLAGLTPSEARRGTGGVALAAGLAVWLLVLVAEAVAMPALAVSTAPGAALLRALVWPLALALGYAAYAAGGIGLALTAPRRPAWIAAWGGASGWLAAATGVLGYALGPAALWIVGPTALSIVLWSVALPFATDPARRRSTRPQRRRDPSGRRAS